MFLTNENKLNFGGVLLGIVLTAVLVMAGVLWFDIPVYNFLRTFNCKFFGILGNIFSAKNWVVLSAIVLLVFFMRKIFQTGFKFSIKDMYDKVRGSYAFWIFSSVLLAVSTGAVLKYVIGRARPIFYQEIGMTGFFPGASDAAFHSMPSGHAMASFAGLVMIGMLAPRAKWFTWTLATVIAVSRVCAGFHWPSDIIFGAFWGVLCANLVRAWMVRRGRA